MCGRFNRLGKLEKEPLLELSHGTKFCMTGSIDPNVKWSASDAEPDKDNLKHWLCELTHLSPQQIERVLAQREQELLNPTLKQPLK
jgi:hypothetical protein